MMKQMLLIYTFYLIFENIAIPTFHTWYIWIQIWNKFFLNKNNIHEIQNSACV